MKSINRIFLLLVIFLSTATTIKAQETMYIYKDGVVVGEHVLADVDSVIFYQPTHGTITDNDGNEYQTVVIGTQTWMAENLKTTTYNDGISISNVTDNTIWGNITVGAYCWYDNNELNYKDTYGALYNWYTVETGKLCPSGWHVPSDEEWTDLINYVTNNGYSGIEGIALKATTGWSYDGNGTDEYSFAAFPGGNRENSQFTTAEHLGYWWSSTAYTDTEAWHRILLSEYSNIRRESTSKNNGKSVRCIKD